MKKNCWEFMNCGRAEGGDKVSEFGICPVANNGNGAHVNGGEHDGRFCWAARGTLCKGEVQGTFARKIADCVMCEFYRLVRKEEGRDFRIY
jgi:hypothetical protein